MKFVMEISWLRCKFAEQRDECIKVRVRPPIHKKRLGLVLADSSRFFGGTHGTDGPFSSFCVVLVYEEMLRACRTSPAAEPPKRGEMKQLIAMAVFILCFGARTAHAQHAVAGGAGTGASNSGGGGGGGGSAAGGVTHHAVWVPASNVSGKNDGPFLPTTYQNYDKALEMGKAQVVGHEPEPNIVEVAKMTQEQKASAAKSRFVVVQDAEGKIQEVKAQP